MADPFSLEYMDYSSSDSVSTTESVQTTCSASSTNVSTQVGITVTFPSAYNSTSYTLIRTSESTSATVSLSSSTSARTTSLTCILGSTRSTTRFSRTNSASSTSSSSSATFTTLTTPLHTTKRHTPGISIDFSSASDTATPTTSSSCMPSSDSGVVDLPTSSSSSSIILNTSNADAKTSFSRNTGAVIGVALASGISLLVIALLVFLGCRRLRRRRLGETGSSDQHLTFDSPGRGSLRSPIDGDEDYFFPAFPNILAAVQLPHLPRPGTAQTSAEGAETIVAEGPFSSQSHINHNMPQTVELRQTPVAFPTHLHSNAPPQGPYSRFHFPSSQDHDAGSPSGPLSALNTTEMGITRKSDTPKILLDPYLPANDHRPNDVPIPNWAAWLYKPTSARVTDSSSSTPQTRDASLPRVPDGLLHPLLSRRFGPIPLGSERSFLDNVDYSRPISGVHARADSFTTFTTRDTQDTAEVKLGHDNDKL